MIDPGHGGKDPGAVANGILGKDVNLAVALKLRKHVVKGDYLFTPFLTRDDDYFMSLKGRCGLANSLKAPLFVSLHCNARRSLGKEGIEIEVYHYPGSFIGENVATVLFNFLFQAIDEKYVCIPRGVKEGDYHVLRETTMPAVLVEMGFLTDPEEARWLNKPENQNVLAQAIAEGIEISLEGGGI
jgi:N-acetylmuramoyl-L-alanine amidase